MTESVEELRRTVALIQYVADRCGTLTPQAAFERHQGLLQIAVKRMGEVRTDDALDESFYTALRSSLVDAGALEADIEAVAYWLVCFIVDNTLTHSDARREHLELIAHYVVRSDMTVRRAPGGRVRVEYPERPSRH